MANISFKSITFPGLANKYQVPEISNDLMTQGKAADSKIVGDELNAIKADLDAYDEAIVDELEESVLKASDFTVKASNITYTYNSAEQSITLTKTSTTQANYQSLSTSSSFLVGKLTAGKTYRLHYRADVLSGNPAIRMSVINSSNSSLKTLIVEDGQDGFIDFEATAEMSYISTYITLSTAIGACSVKYSDIYLCELTGKTAIDNKARMEIVRARSDLFDSIGLETKTGFYCKGGYIGSSGYTTDEKRCQMTDFLPETAMSVSCTDAYLIYLAAYNASTGAFVGYYTTAGTLAVSPIDKQTYFDLRSIKSALSGYKWRVTIQTSDNTSISSAVYPITIAYIDTDSTAGKCTDRKISEFCALTQGGIKGTGSALTSTKYVRSSYLIGIEKIKMAEGYLVTAVSVCNAGGDAYLPYIFREGLELDTGSSALNYGYVEVNLRELQGIYPNGVIRLIFHKVDFSDITPSEVDSACSVVIDASAYEADAIVSRYNGRYRVSPNYAPSNLVKSHVIATIGADKIQGGLITTPNNGVSAYGQLYVDSTTLKLTSSVTSEAVQLKGVCVWNIAEGSQAATLYGLKAMRRRGANLVRVVCFPTTNAGRGYLEMANKSAYMDTLKQIAYDAMSLDMYVVIDWHLLHVGNPLTYVTEATEFFDEMSDEFISCPNVMYEICNEPNGSRGTWANIKTYAETIIPVIRANSPDAVCIVGTPNYSRDLSPIAANPVELANILYTYHWYRTYDYTTELSPYVSALPIFVTEWGAKASTSGSGMSYNVKLAQEMLDVLSENKISWMAWSLWQGNSSNGSTFFIKDYQSNKMRTYGGWPYYVFNEFGRLVVDNLVVN